VIAAYDYVGLSHVLRESYPTPKVRLDYWGGTSGTFTGWDNFDRTCRPGLGQLQRHGIRCFQAYARLRPRFQSFVRG